MENLVRENQMLKAKLNLALEALKKNDLSCVHCRHNIDDNRCDEADCACEKCNNKCPCSTCHYNSNWAWKEDDKI